VTAPQKQNGSLLLQRKGCPAQKKTTINTREINFEKQIDVGEFFEMLKIDMKNGSSHKQSVEFHFFSGD
jgi:hypothetical protein